MLRGLVQLTIPAIFLKPGSSGGSAKLGNKFSSVALTQGVGGPS